eukprot:scaffold234_cov406-Prasinococcus_capsulatus_cf.AAC.14
MGIQDVTSATRSSGGAPVNRLSRCEYSSASDTVRPVSLESTVVISVSTALAISASESKCTPPTLVPAVGRGAGTTVTMGAPFLATLRTHSITWVAKLRGVSSLTYRYTGLPRPARFRRCRWYPARRRSWTPSAAAAWHCGREKAPDREPLLPKLLVSATTSQQLDKSLPSQRRKGQTRGHEPSGVRVELDCPRCGRWVA